MAKVGWLLCLLMIGTSSWARAGDPRETTAGAAQVKAADEARAGSETRNPFGLPDVEDCCGEESRRFADGQSPGGEDDGNASAWPTASSGPHDSIDGSWSGRWRREEEAWVEGTATVETVGDTVFIHFKDEIDYLIEARREGDRLIGRYVNAGQKVDSLYWTGFVVSNERIDGFWPLGRWDFRRGAGEATK
jgi:hypothetical protein